MPGGYMLTAHGQNGWRDVAVIGTNDMREAIELAEKVTGCRVSHGQGGINGGFDPAITIDAVSGEVTKHHQRKAKPVVELGPPDVLRAINEALKPAKQS
jgi:hypothetical protein